MTTSRWLLRPLIAALIIASPAAGFPPDDTGEHILRLLSARSTTAMPAPTDAEWAGLLSLYAGRGHAPLWFDRDGVLRPLASEAITLLDRAADDGLVSADYGVAALRAQFSRCDTRQPPTAMAAALDISLTASLSRFLRDLRIGRVEPRAMGFDLTPVAFDATSAVIGAIESRDLGTALCLARPPLAEYEQLRAALGALGRDEGREGLPLPAVRQSLRTGDSYAGAAALHARLVLLGDMAPGSVEGEKISAPLVAALTRFQARHGLDADGVLGRDTLAALNVPLRERIEQVVLAMERLRWLPPLDHDRVVFVNSAAFRLWARDPARPPSAVPLSTAIIVGAKRTPTPVLTGWIDSLHFQPPWNVPLSIARNEIVPILGRDADYLQRHRIDVVDANGRVVTEALTAVELEGVRSGQLRLRQRPGPGNALGLIKFHFENNRGVYLHSTSTPELFRRWRRDLSHGCVRIEDAAALAEWILADSTRWPASAVAAALERGEPQTIAVRPRVRVLLFYTTAYVSPDTHALHFAADNYGHDARLRTALTRARAAEGGLR